MSVPKGFEQFYPVNVVLLFLKTIYGLRQSSFEYWKKLATVLEKQKLDRSKADRCVYFKWEDKKVTLWASWVDDLIGAGTQDHVIAGREEIKKDSDLDEVGELAEYVGCKIDYNRERKVECGSLNLF